MLRYLVTVIEIPERKVLPAAQTSVVGILEDPGFRAALGRVELIRFVEDFKKDILHQIFRLTPVTKDSQSNFQNKPVKAIKQNDQGVRMSLPELLHHVVVRKV